VTRHPLSLCALAALAAISSAPARSADTAPLESLVLEALENNLELKIERVEPVIASQSTTLAEAEFDPLAQMSIQRQDSDRFVNNILEISEDLNGGTIQEIRYTPQGSLQAKLASGMEYSFSATTPIIETDNPLRIYDRAYTPLVSAEFTQPLVRDAGPRVNRLRIDQARAGERHAAQNVAAKVLQVIRDVESAYWTLGQARRHVEILRESVGICEQRAKRGKEMAAAGFLSDADALSAEVAAEERRGDLAQAETDFARARIYLREVVGSGPERAAAVQPASSLPDDPLPSSDPATLVSLALDRRPEIRAQESVIAEREAEERLAENDLRLRFDALGSLSYGGLAGADPLVDRPLVPLPPALEGRDTFFDAFEHGAFSWMVGLRLSVPIGNRADEARLGSNRGRLDQERLRLSLLKSRIGAEVETTLQDTIAAWARFQSSLKIVELARENLGHEEQRLEAGLATDFDVLDAKDRLSSAQEKLLARHLAYALARSRLQAADGGSFDTYRLQTATD
jgi:outer membrane protein TolC